MRFSSLIRLVLLLAPVCFPIIGFADTSDTSQAGLQWEAPLVALRNSITGPVAFTVSVLALVACGTALAMGAEMNDLVKRVLMVVLSIAIIVFASGLIGTLFEGAETIPELAEQAQVEAIEC